MDSLRGLFVPGPSDGVKTSHEAKYERERAHPGVGYSSFIECTEDPVRYAKHGYEARNRECVTDFVELDGDEGQ